AVWQRPCANAWTRELGADGGELCSDAAVLSVAAVVGCRASRHRDCLPGIHDRFRPSACAPRRRHMERPGCAENLSERQARRAKQPLFIASLLCQSRYIQRDITHTPMSNRAAILSTVLAMPVQASPLLPGCERPLDAEVIEPSKQRTRI